MQSPLKLVVFPISALLVALVVSTAGCKKAAPDESLAKRLDPNAKIPRVQFDAVPLDVGIENLARQGEINYILGFNIPDLPVNGHYEDQTAREVLVKLLKEHKLALMADTVTGVARIAKETDNAPRVDANWVAGGTNYVIPLIIFQEVPLDVALTKLAAADATKMTVDPRISGVSLLPGQPSRAAPTIAVRWENLRPRQAIAALCQNYHLVISTNAVGETQIAIP